MSDTAGWPIPVSVGGVGACVPQQDNQGAPPLSQVSGDGAGSEPDCVPVPQDELTDLKMTTAEFMEYFSFRLEQENLKDEDEPRFKLAWLRAKRSGALNRNPKEQERGAAYEAMFGQTTDSDKPEAA
jgi:hypothetical protein